MARLRVTACKGPQRQSKITPVVTTADTAPSWWSAGTVGSHRDNSPSAGRTAYPPGRARARRGGLSAPLLLQWQLVQGAPGGDGLPTGAVLAVLDDIRAIELLQIEFLGNSDLRPDFFDIVEYAVGRGIGVRFATSGSMIDEARARWLAVAQDVAFTLVLDDVDAALDAPPLRALRVFADVPVRGFTVRLPATGRAEDEVLHLADRCHARLRSDIRPGGQQPDGRAVRKTAAPVWLIDIDGQVHLRDDREVHLGSILDPGGFLAIWERYGHGEAAHLTAVPD